MADRMSFPGNRRPGPGALLLFAFFAGTLLIGVLLFGERLMLLNLTFAAVFTALLWGCAAWIDASRSTGFSLDDGKRCIVTNRGEIIAFNKVRQVTVAGAADGVCGYVVVGRLGIKKHIFYSRDPGCSDHLRAQLRHRFENLRVKNASLRLSTLDFLPLIVIPLTAVVLAGMIGYFYWSYPILTVFPEKVTLAAEGQVEGQWFSRGGLSFCVPDTFLPVHKSPGRLLLQSPAGGATLFADTTRRIFARKYSVALEPVLYAAGLGTDYDFVEMAYRSRLGLMPLVFKAALLSLLEPDTLHLYRFSSGNWSGFMTRGMFSRDNQRLCKTDLTVTHIHEPHHLYLSIRRPRFCPDDRFAANIINSLKKRQTVLMGE